MIAHYITQFLSQNVRLLVGPRVVTRLDFRESNRSPHSVTAEDGAMFSTNGAGAASPAGAGAAYLTDAGHLYGTTSAGAHPRQAQCNSPLVLVLCIQLAHARYTPPRAQKPRWYGVLHDGECDATLLVRCTHHWRGSGEGRCWCNVLHH